MRDLTRGLELIKEFEGLKLKAYLDPVGIPTIGWGTTTYPNGVKVKMGDTITAIQAEEYFRHHQQTYVDALEKAIKVPLNDHMLGALMSWTYNVGAGAMRNSTLVRVLNQGNYLQAADELLRWNKATNRVTGIQSVLPGLTRRREAERDLFLEPAEMPQETKDLEDVVTPSWFEPFKAMIKALFDAIFGAIVPDKKPEPTSKHPDYAFARTFLIQDGVHHTVVDRFINYWAESTNANFAYFFNYDKHCSVPRLYIFSKRNELITQRKSTHGIGSDPSNTGYAHRFSNISGSKQSTLGLVRTAETYIGRNGRSLRLDGLDATNKIMRQRLIVIHGANYAESCGRSEGCPTIHHTWAQEDIENLKLGSPGFHYHKSMV